MKRKIFLSCPMKDRKEFDIKQTLEKMKKVVLAMYPGDDIDFYDNFESGRKLTGTPAVNNAKHPELKYLGLAITKMADCDMLVNIDSPIMYRVNSNGCYIESEVAYRYFTDRNNSILTLKDPNGTIFLGDLADPVNSYDRKKYYDYRAQLIDKVKDLVAHGYSIDEAAKILGIKTAEIEKAWSEEVDECCSSDEAEPMDLMD